MKPSKSQQIRDLTAEVQQLKSTLTSTIEDMGKKVALAQAGEHAAQRGLVPYVAAVQALNRWLLERPNLSGQVNPILAELGLLGVRLGYDPDRDLALSIIDGRKRNR